MCIYLLLPQRSSVIQGHSDLLLERKEKQGKKDVKDASSHVLIRQWQSRTCQLALCDCPHTEGSHTAQAAPAGLHRREGAPGAWEEKVRPPQKALPVTLS